MPIKYACINDEKNLVVDHPSGVGLPAEILQKVIGLAKPKTLVCKTVVDDKGSLVFHYFATGEGRVFGCVATDDVPARMIFPFLHTIESQVKLLDLTDTKGLKLVLKQQTERYNDPSADKIKVLENEIKEVHGLLIKNLEKVLEREDHLSVMLQKSHEIVRDAEQFVTVTKKAKWKMMWQHYQMYILIFVAVVIAILIIVMIACGASFDK
eukprot:PhF_6_TR3477/c0_g1_i2/m.5105/K08515/VAMP7; vesicle-associated membrane protein 7